MQYKFWVTISHHFGELEIHSSTQQCIRNKVIFTKKVVISNWFAGLKFDPGDEWPEGIRVLRKLAKRDTDDNDRRRLKTKFVGDVEVVVKGNF